MDPRTARRCGAWTTLVCAIACVPWQTAEANGRFPAAQHVVVGPGAASDTVVLRTTFGLLVSRDGGGTFRWLCEDAMYAPDFVSGNSDPAVEIAADGTLVWGYEYGIHSTQTGCAVSLQPSAGNDVIADLAADPTGAILVAIEDHAAGANHVLRAEGGEAFSRLGFGLTGVDLVTVEVAPSNPSVVYVSGMDQTDIRTPRLYRSADQGSTLVPWTATLGAIDDAPYISGVDPTDPDVVYVRANVGMGSRLYRSHDGGATVSMVVATVGSMLGFAISTDGATVWVGSPTDGLLRSDDHGLTFAVVNPVPTYCLRFHAGVLWQCGDWNHTYALGRSHDQGHSFEPVLQFQDIAGPYDCATVPSSDGNRCADLWPVQQNMLGPARDAGRRDATTDVTPLTDVTSDLGSGASDAALDAGLQSMPHDAGRGPVPPAGSATGCGCTVETPPGGAQGVMAVCALAVTVRRRRQRPSR